MFLEKMISLRQLCFASHKTDRHSNCERSGYEIYTYVGTECDAVYVMLPAPQTMWSRWLDNQCRMNREECAKKRLWPS